MAAAAIIEVETVEIEQPKPIDKKKIPASEDDREKLVDKLMDRFRAYADHRKNGCEIEAVWDACYRAYRGFKPDKGPYEYMYVIREIFRQIEVLKPQLYEQFFESAELFEYVPEEPGFDEEARGATAVVRRQIRYHKLEEQMRRWLDNAVLYGTSFLMAYWKSFADRKLKISAVYDVDENKSAWDRESNDLNEEGPAIEAVPPWRVYAHPDIEDVRKSPVVFIEDVVSASQLKTYVKANYLDDKMVKKALNDKEKGSASGASTDDRQAQHLPSHPWFEEDKELDDVHTMLTCWTNDGWEYVIIDKKYLVRGRENDLKKAPIMTLRNYPQQDELWGLPEPLQMLDDQNLLNDTMGMWVTGVKLASMPMMKCRGSDAFKKWKNIVFRPGGGVLLENHEDDIEPLQLSPIAFQLPSVAAFIMGNMKQGSGVTDELAGISTGQKKTATEHVSLREAASARMRYKVVTFAPSFVEMFEMFYQLNAMYLDEDVAVRLGGQEAKRAFMFVRPDVFEHRVSVDVKLANTLEVGAEAALKWMNVYARMGQDPMVDRQMIIERIFKALGEKEPKRFLNDPTLALDDATTENDKIAAYGIVDDPKPNDQHQIHYKIHTLFMQTAMFTRLPEMWQQAFIRHLTIHQEYLQAQARTAQEAQQAGGDDLGLGQDSGSPVPATDVTTEATFDNGATGAIHEGAVA
jgi:hypothetical protein